MTCPVCGKAPTNVIDSRPTNEDGTIIRRRRVCGVCQHRFTTYEVVSTVLADAVERNQAVADARNTLISDFTASLPEVPGVKLRKLRPAK